MQAGADVLSKDKYAIPVLLKAYFRHAFDYLEALVAEGPCVCLCGDDMNALHAWTHALTERAPLPLFDCTHAGGLPLATKFEPRDRHTLACFAARDGRTDLLARLHRQVRACVHWWFVSIDRDDGMRSPDESPSSPQTESNRP